MPSDIFRLNGPKLAELRFRAGYSRAGLAAKLGVHRNYIGRIESGKFEPAPARLVAIAEALGVELDAITERVAA